MDRQRVIAEIRGLDLPVDQYVVVGGASKTIRGLRDTSDIDLVVTPALFHQLSAQGWPCKPRPNGEPGLKRGAVEVYLDVSTPGFAPGIDWLIANAETQAGIPLVDLETLLTWKREYGRKKDARDIELLRAICIGGRDDG